VKGNESVPDDFGHSINVASMRPVRVVNRGKGQVLSLVSRMSGWWEKVSNMVRTRHSRAVNIMCVASRL